jgi:sulfoxide reductase heme-binding subunit YedZ
MAKALPWLSPGVRAGAMVPFLVLSYRWGRGTLGADPVAIALNQLGLVALILLWASLTCTPLKALFGWTWPMRIRRELGLLAFLYAMLHVFTYVVVDQGLHAYGILADIGKRKFITVGFAAFVLLVVLALTSFKSSPRRLGFARWEAIHRLVYPAAILASVHFVWRVKRDRSEPFAYAAVLGVLFAVRLWKRFSKPRARPALAR